MVEVEFTNEFNGWWEDLDEAEQDSIDVVVGLLEAQGIGLGVPYCSQVKGSRHGHMRELRIQHKGRPFRILYAFDPRRTAILLIGGDKTGDDRFYVKMIRKGDALYDVHLEELRREGRT